MGIDLEKYVTVDRRITEFWDRYPDGRIETGPHDWVDDGKRCGWLCRARIFRPEEESPAATGEAFEPFPGRTPYTRGSELMNGETSAVGRALGIFGIGLGCSVASRDEVELAVSRQDQPSPVPVGDVLKLIADATSVEELRALWKNLQSTRRMTPEVEKLLVERKDSLQAADDAA